MLLKTTIPVITNWVNVFFNLQNGQKLYYVLLHSMWNSPYAWVFVFHRSMNLSMWFIIMNSSAIIRNRWSSTFRFSLRDRHATLHYFTRAGKYPGRYRQMTHFVLRMWHAKVTCFWVPSLQSYGLWCPENIMWGCDMSHLTPVYM